ncbi:hypothetical protein Pint_14875 [Pistacia integerrima]|uniref:Uncharacterized protein n=1 Tax=Pistacia integerrima TaxID=434235 RepID=A0ACC0Z9M9_9ROSI|nr:hypothetical protein Pint_14875 [Pistacia integerrima]
MAIATFSPSFYCTRTESGRLTRFSLVHSHKLPSRVRIVSRLNSSNNSVSPADHNSNNNNDSGDSNSEEYEHHHRAFLRSRRKGSPVFVKLPEDTTWAGGILKRKKAVTQSFKALAAAGVEGVLMEVYWGVVEKDRPRIYDWGGYLDLVDLASKCGLKIRALFAFHGNGTGPGDRNWISLPKWVLEEIDKDPDLAYTDRFGRRSMEYISLGCDSLPVLQGRSPIQAYTDLMRNFRDTFRPFLGVIITGIQVGMGPAGELRYPLSPSQKLTRSWRTCELGEFQCYDKYMLASLNACARGIGRREWGDGGPIGAGNLMQDAEKTEFFRSRDGSWNTEYGNFFLEWYSGMLLLHGERLCREATTIFRGARVDTSAKVGGIYWHYGTQSHPSELTAGYYNTSTRDGYMPIARMFARYGFTMCCSCFEMRDVYEKHINPHSSPEGFLRQLLLAARICEIPLEGENFATDLDDAAFQQMLKMSKYYSDGIQKPSFSFNFVRMDKSMFEYNNWVRFTHFVRQLSDASSFRAKLDFRGNIRPSSSATSDATKVGVAFAYG